MKSKAYMYILLCNDGSYYTGSTTNLDIRISQHLTGEGSNYTRKHKPIKLLYTEEYNSIEEAYLREKQVQGWSRRKKEALICGEWEKSENINRPSTSSGTDLDVSTHK
ncbi:MAG: GIY-YIG nuclease family protein [Paludibacteraceae bacterium]|nr:GIY-YIG nuclease family protein [Paludibacteraceae bacterium]